MQPRCCITRSTTTRSGSPVGASAARSPSAFRLPPSKGLTLVELLVVMSILVLLLTAAIPAITPDRDERRLREASRGVNTFIAGAQARAVQSGRPFGVMLKKLSQETGDDDDNAVCLELYYVEEPAPYAGFEASSRVVVSQVDPSLRRVQLRFAAAGTAATNDGLPVGWDADLVPPQVFRPGDRIVVAGVYYQLLNGQLAGEQVANPLDGFFEPNTGQLVTFAAAPVDASTLLPRPVYDNFGTRVTDSSNQTAPFWSEPLRYQIHRQPVLTSAPPYQLPEGAAIDLRASGTRSTVFFKADPSFDDVISSRTEVRIMFSPEGTVSQLYASLDDPENNDTDDTDRLQAGTVTSDIYLLVGLRENIPVADNAAFAGFTGTDSELLEAKSEVNWLNSDCRWVTIGSQTGSVATSQNAFVNPVAVANDTDYPTLPQRRDRQIELSRELALQKATEGGR